MQLLCFAALLLSAVAARPDSWKPRHNETFPPTGGPKLDANSKHRENAPVNGSRESDGDRPELGSGHQGWVPNTPSRRPGNGNPRWPKKGTNGTDSQAGRPSQVSTWGKRQVPGFMLAAGVRHPMPNKRNPGAMVFSSMYKFDNVTFQNVTDVTLKEGENIFLMPKHDEMGPHHPKGGKQGPPKNGFQQYVKLIYNATEPNKVGIEYGVFKPMNISKIVGEENNPEK